MRKVGDIAANALSILLYPLFVPTYGMALFCYAFSRQVQSLPLVWSVVAICGTLFLTCILPLTSILILIRQGKVSGLQIEKAGERTMPYVYSTLGFGFWSYLLIAILHAPLYISLVAVGGTVAIGLVTLINRRWKISAHLTGMGGLLGGLLSYCLGVGAIPTWGTLCLWLTAALALMYARLWLKAHTPAQVVTGWFLGLLCTYSPYLILHYAA